MSIIVLIIIERPFERREERALRVKREVWAYTHVHIRESIDIWVIYTHILLFLLMFIFFDALLLIIFAMLICVIFRYALLSMLLSMMLIFAFHFRYYLFAPFVFMRETRVALLYVFVPLQLLLAVAIYYTILSYLLLEAESVQWGRRGGGESAAEWFFPCLYDIYGCHCWFTLITWVAIMPTYILAAILLLYILHYIKLSIIYINYTLLLFHESKEECSREWAQRNPKRPSRICLPRECSRQVAEAEREREERVRHILHMPLLFCPVHAIIIILLLLPCLLCLCHAISCPCYMSFHIFWETCHCCRCGVRQAAQQSASAFRRIRWEQEARASPEAGERVLRRECRAGFIYPIYYIHTWRGSPEFTQEEAEEEVAVSEADVSVRRDIIKRARATQVCPPHTAYIMMLWVMMICA